MAFYQYFFEAIQHYIYTNFWRYFFFYSKYSKKKVKTIKCSFYEFIHKKNTVNIGIFEFFQNNH